MHAILLSGGIKSGKTSVARILADKLGASFAAFGDNVRERARQRNIELADRKRLQDIGQELVSQDPCGFLEAVLMSADPPLSRNRDIVLDGIRHKVVLDMARDRLLDWRVHHIHIDANVELRIERARVYGIPSEELARADAHETESETVELRDKADLCVSGDFSADIIAELILRLLE